MGDCRLQQAGTQRYPLKKMSAHLWELQYILDTNEIWQILKDFFSSYWSKKVNTLLLQHVCYLRWAGTLSFSDTQSQKCPCKVTLGKFGIRLCLSPCSQGWTATADLYFCGITNFQLNITTLGASHHMNTIHYWCPQVLVWLQLLSPNQSQSADLSSCVQYIPIYYLFLFSKQIFQKSMQNLYLTFTTDYFLFFLFLSSKSMFATSILICVHQHGHEPSANLLFFYWICWAAVYLAPHSNNYVNRRTKRHDQSIKKYSLPEVCFRV